jgi:hypothetical protein
VSSEAAGRIVLSFDVDDKSIVPGLSKVKGELDNAKKGAEDAGGGFGALGGIMDGLGVSMGGLTIAGGVAIFGGAVKSAYDLSGVLNDLHDKTGLSIGFLQDLKFAGDQVGVPLDASAKGVQQLQKRIVEGGPEITKALKSVGLTVSDLRSQNPDQMFESIAKAIAGIEDPAQRTATATALLGKSGADLVPILVNFEEARQGAVHLSDDAAKGFDAIGDAIARWKDNAEADIGNFIGRLTSLKGIITDVINVASMGHLDGKGIVDAASNQFGIDDQTSAAMDAIARHLETVRKGAIDIVPPLRSAADAQADFEKQFGTPKQALARNEAAAAEDKHAEAIQKLADTLTGKDVAQKVKDLAAAEQLAEKQGGVTAYQQEQLGKQLLTLSEQGAKIPAVLQPIVERAAALSLNSKVAADGVVGLNKELSNFPSYGLQAIPTFDNLIGKSGDLDKFLRTNLGPAIKELPAPPPDPWQAWHDGVNNMLSGPGGLVENMGTTIGSLTHGWDDFWGNLKQTASSVFDDLVSMLIHQFLDPALDAILGQKSAFGHAISSLFDVSGSSASSALSIPGTTAVNLSGAPIGGGGAGVGAGLLAAAESAGLGAAAAGAGYLLGKMGTMLVQGISETGWLGLGSSDERDRDALIAQLGLGQYGYQYSTDQLEAMVNSGQIPQMADGGIVHAQPGGGLFRLGEGRFDEMVTPLDPRDINEDGDKLELIIDGERFWTIMLPRMRGGLRRYQLA